MVGALIVTHLLWPVAQGKERAMADDEDFEPRLGRLRSLGSKRARSFLARVLQATNLARGGGGTAGRSAFAGSRIGRGSGAGRVLGSRDAHAAFRQRRVIIKSRIVRLSGAKGMDGARAHLRYIQRDGVTREGEPGQLYAAEHEQVDGKAFLDRTGGDRHQFRFILSAEDGASYEDLKPLTGSEISPFAFGRSIAAPSRLFRIVPVAVKSSHKSAIIAWPIAPASMRFLL
jgi:hypothetical protein